MNPNLSTSTVHNGQTGPTVHSGREQRLSTRDKQGFRTVYIGTYGDPMINQVRVP